MKKVTFLEASKCTGCGACADVCPAKCIKLSADEEGFLYPTVSIEECIQCGKCERICPVISRREKGGEITAYAAKSRNEQIQMQSSSGGVFTEIAQYILKNGGVVFGAGLDEKFKVKHICVDTVEQLELLRGSKYVQSEIGTSYQRAKEFLAEGKTVLFTGTPCQIAGLHAFLGKEYENLYSQDIICHGVPSPFLWEQYVRFRENRANSSVRRVSFRNKETGWQSYSMLLEFSNDMKYMQLHSSDPYMQSFLKNLCLRPSCYNCAFKTRDRYADFTLADFWGVEWCNPNMLDNKGVSLVLMHSPKGKELFNQIKDTLLVEETNFEKAISFNSAMEKSVAYKPERNDFMKCVQQRGFSTAACKYLKAPLLLRLKRMVRRMLKK